MTHIVTFDGWWRGPAISILVAMKPPTLLRFPMPVLVTWALVLRPEQASPRPAAAGSSSAAAAVRTSVAMHAVAP